MLTKKTTIKGNLHRYEDFRMTAVNKKQRLLKVKSPTKIKKEARLFLSESKICSKISYQFCPKFDIYIIMEEVGWISEHDRLSSVHLVRSAAIYFDILTVNESLTTNC